MEHTSHPSTLEVEGGESEIQGPTQLPPWTPGPKELYSPAAGLNTAGSPRTALPEGRECNTQVLPLWKKELNGQQAQNNFPSHPESFLPSYPTGFKYGIPGCPSVLPLL